MICSKRKVCIDIVISFQYRGSNCQKNCGARAMQTTVGQKIFKEFKTKKLVKRYYNQFFWKFLGVVYFPFLTLVSLSEKKYILKKI